MSGLRALRTCAAQLLCKSELSAEQITERALSSLGASASSQQLAVPSFWFGPSSHGAGSLPHLPQRAFASKAGGKDAGGGKGAGGKAGAASGKDAATQAAAPTALSVQLSDKPSAYPSLPLPPGIGALVPPSKPYELVPELPQRDVAFKAQYVPWTPTRQLQRRRKISKRMAFLVQVLEKEHEVAAHSLRQLPKFSVGDVLEVHVVVAENERKEYVYRGVCIAKSDKGLRSSFKIYNVFPDAGGVVQHFPLYMPDLLGVKIVGRVHAAQSHLYHLLHQADTKQLRFQAQPEVVAASPAAAAS